MAFTMLGALALAIPALAEDNAPPTNPPAGLHGEVTGRGLGRMGMMKPAIIGTVSAVNANILTVSGHLGFSERTAATTTFTVDATNAKVRKANATSTVSSIVVGDMVMIQGTVSGNNVTATVIRDGITTRGPGRGNKDGTTTPNTFPVQGNGQPVVAGTVSSISGSTITITNKSNVTYTVDAGSAKILKGPNPISISNITVGDNVIVQGSVNGTSITASTVIDQLKPVAKVNQGNSNANNEGRPERQGVLGGIGQFFAHLFGF